MQNELDELDASIMALSFLRIKDDKVKLEAVKLGVALLFGGNLRIQKHVYKFFLGTREETFFSDVALILQDGMEDLKEKKRLLQQRANAIADARSAGIEDIGTEMTEIKQILNEDHGDFDLITQLLRFLQLFCEGHNTDMQNYLRSQPDNIKPYDVVTETCNFLIGLERYVDNYTSDLTIQLFACLTEYCQGCAQNQNAIVRAKVCNACAKLLTQRQEFASMPSAVVTDIQKAVLILLTSLLEGNNDREIAEKMKNSLDFNLLFTNLTECYARYSSKVKITDTHPREEGDDRVDERVNEISDEDKEEALEIGFLYYILLSMLGEYFGDEVDALFNPKDGTKFEGGNLFSAGMGRIEILRDNKLERVFYRLPKSAKHLHNKSKETLLWTVNRATPTEKLDDFLQRTDGLLFEIEHQEHINDSLATNIWLKPLAIVAKYELYLQRLVFIIAIIINVTMLFSFVSDFDQNNVSLSSNTSITAIIVLAILHLIFTILLVSIFFANWGPTYIFKYHLAKYRDTPGTDKTHPRELLATNPALYYIKGLTALFTNYECLYRILFLTFSILGNFNAFIPQYALFFCLPFT